MKKSRFRIRVGKRWNLDQSDSQRTAELEKRSDAVLLNTFTKVCVFRRECCQISTPLPMHLPDLESSISFAVSAILEIVKFRASWPSFNDRVVVVLTCGRTPTGSPVIWPHLFHLFNSKTQEASETFSVHNSKTRYFKNTILI